MACAVWMAYAASVHMVIVREGSREGDRGERWRISGVIPSSSLHPGIMPACIFIVSRWQTHGDVYLTDRRSSGRCYEL